MGLISFGGPAAHIGYFRTTFVERLKWLDDKTYANFIALSQFLPGPSSSQVGFTIGLNRAGLGGGIAAFLGFTLPSFLLFYFLAIFDTSSVDSALINGIVNGLKLFAVIIVVDAVYGMYNSFCKDILSRTIALLTTMILLFFATLGSQIAALFMAALIGMQFKRNDTKKRDTKNVKLKVNYLIAFFAFLFMLPLLSYLDERVSLFSAFYEAGSLVFGGGHVVLPLLQQTVGENLSNDTFLVGYSAAQAVPGPMFTLASYLGANMLTQTPFLGSVLAVTAIFIPGFLLILAFKDSWESFAKQPKVSAAVYGINASVVGILAAALINPIAANAIYGINDAIIAVIGYILLRVVKIPVYWLIILFCLIGVLVLR